MTEKINYPIAENMANKMNKALETEDLQICTYGSRTIVKKGRKIKADGYGIRIVGYRPFFPIGSFKVYYYR